MSKRKTTFRYARTASTLGPRRKNCAPKTCPHHCCARSRHSVGHPLQCDAAACGSQCGAPHSGAADKRGRVCLFGDVPFSVQRCETRAL